MDRMLSIAGLPPTSNSSAPVLYTWVKRGTVRASCPRDAGMAQWWERLPPTAVAWVRFPDPASHVGWVCYWFSSSFSGFSPPGFSGFPPSTKTNTPNRPFPSSLVPLFQGESKCETILMKMTLICMKMKLRAELIFIWKVSHLDSLWNRGTRELGNGLVQFDLEMRTTGLSALLLVLPSINKVNQLLFF